MKAKLLHLKYEFRETYKDNKGVIQEVVVSLYIDTIKGKFSIRPELGTNNYFVFTDNYEDFARWKAITKMINKAIDLAEEKLKEYDEAHNYLYIKD